MSKVIIIGSRVAYGPDPSLYGNMEVTDRKWYDIGTERHMFFVCRLADDSIELFKYEELELASVMFIEPQPVLEPPTVDA